MTNEVLAAELDEAGHELVHGLNRVQAIAAELAPRQRTVLCQFILALGRFLELLDLIEAEV